MAREVVVILPGTLDTSRNIARYLRDLDVEIRIIPLIKIKIDWDEIESARKVYSLGFAPDVSIFTSKTAVKIVKKLIPEAWRQAVEYSIAIGPGTASLLKKLGVKIIEYPTEHSSKGLVELLSKISKSSSLALYCSKHVSLRLKEFIEQNFEPSIIFRLYTILEAGKNIEQLVNLIESYPMKTFVITITCYSILRILAKTEKFSSSQNVVYSVLGSRLLKEASRLKFHIHHGFPVNSVEMYYDNLRNYIRELLAS